MRRWNRFDKHTGLYAEARAMGVSPCTIHRLRALDVLGHSCEICGFTDDRAIQIDHIHGGGKQEYLLKGSQSIYIWISQNPIEAKKKYRSLCANCNMIAKHENKHLGGKRGSKWVPAEIRDEQEGPPLLEIMSA